MTNPVLGALHASSAVSIAGNNYQSGGGEVDIKVGDIVSLTDTDRVLPNVSFSQISHVVVASGDAPTSRPISRTQYNGGYILQGLTSGTVYSICALPSYKGVDAATPACTVGYTRTFFI